ncbi:hypothetical protein EV188_103743 [Actinomycetospora succinea]|uniref:Uncharacterized protein n=1 Tax=Actinomycetospora succinea TaxID=663603 RepID=A0A4R6VIP1_9PSEU|nr:hypothetical protein [Actinomycetospora succinea]TDQ61236.1 hypothetical protein EV188_103743 [Actinomycetospora succinea]
MEPLKFYEVVLIKDNPRTRRLGVARRVSAVIGRAEEDGRWYYSVDDGGETVGLESEDLEGTGRVLDRSAFYPEDPAQVRVSSRGELLDPPTGVESPVSIDFPAEYAVRDGRPWFVGDASIGTVIEFYLGVGATATRLEVGDVLDDADLLRRIEEEVSLPPGPRVSPERSGGIARGPVLAVVQGLDTLWQRDTHLAATVLLTMELLPDDVATMAGPELTVVFAGPWRQTG